MRTSFNALVLTLTLSLAIGATACVGDDQAPLEVGAGDDARALGVTSYIVDHSSEGIVVDVMASDQVLGTLVKNQQQVSMQREGSAGVCTLSARGASRECESDLTLISAVFGDPSFHQALVAPPTCSADSGFGCTASAATAASRCSGLAIFNYCTRCLGNDATSCAICGYCLGY